MSIIQVELCGYIKCPHCKAPKGIVCSTPRGKVLLHSHKARVELARKKNLVFEVKSKSKE